MKRFLVLYSGPPARRNPSHKGWPQWFSKVGDALVDLGSPMADGFVLHTDGSTREDATGLNGCSVVQARDRPEVLDLLSDHPYLTLGGEHTIEVFELSKRSGATGIEDRPN